MQEAGCGGRASCTVNAIQCAKHDCLSNKRSKKLHHHAIRPKIAQAQNAAAICHHNDLQATQSVTVIIVGATGCCSL